MRDSRRWMMVLGAVLSACAPDIDRISDHSVVLADASGGPDAPAIDAGSGSDAVFDGGGSSDSGGGDGGGGGDAGPAVCRARNLGNPTPRFVRFSYGSNASETTPNYDDFPRSISELMTHRRADRWRTGEPNPHAGCGSNCHSGGMPARTFGTIYLQVFDRQLGAFRPGMLNTDDAVPALPDGFSAAEQWLSILRRIRNGTMPRSAVFPETYPRWIDYDRDFTTTRPQDGFNQFPSPVNNDFMRRAMMNYILDRLDALCEQEVCCSLPVELEPNPNPRALSRYACEQVGGTVIADRPMCIVI